jgi:DNA mismatch endonuclease, patch repair protein
MADTLTIEQRSKRMGQVRGRDTAPELLVRRLVHAMGYRYRLHRADLPGKPDLVFPVKRRVIFVHGCFWHRHQDPNCKLARMPKSKLDFWLPKLSANAERDARTEAILIEKGWKILVLWECQLNDRPSLEARIRSFLGP